MQLFDEVMRLSDLRSMAAINSLIGRRKIYDSNTMVEA